jgi:hypothetical protein
MDLKPMRGIKKSLSSVKPNTKRVGEKWSADGLGGMDQEWTLGRGRNGIRGSVQQSVVLLTGEKRIEI